MYLLDNVTFATYSSETAAAAAGGANLTAAAAATAWLILVPPWAGMLSKLPVGVGAAWRLREVRRRVLRRRYSSRNFQFPGIDARDPHPSSRCLARLEYLSFKFVFFDQFFK